MLGHCLNVFNHSVTQWHSSQVRKCNLDNSSETMCFKRCNICLYKISFIFKINKTHLLLVLDWQEWLPCAANNLFKCDIFLSSEHWRTFLCIQNVQEMTSACSRQLDVTLFFWNKSMQNINFVCVSYFRWSPSPRHHPASSSSSTSSSLSSPRARCHSPWYRIFYYNTIY